MAAMEGYLLITDITGYTAYLTQSELEHAEEILRNLLDLIIVHNRPPLVISRLEGDAVISYTPKGGLLQGQSFIEAIENCYVQFRRAREQMELNTTCPCAACRNIPNLDLKFFVHYGTFVQQQLGGHTELLGTDVNLVHRLTKNSITEKTGLRAYAVYTEAAVRALDIAEIAVAFTPHSESYEHLGRVELFVQDLPAVWQRERGQNRRTVRPEDAFLALSHDFPLSQPLLWDYVTKPETRHVLFTADSMKLFDRVEGRVANGSVYHCAHGKTTTPQTVVDWQPFDEYTTEDAQMLGIKMLGTLRLTLIEQGTRLTYLCSRAYGTPLLRNVFDILMRREVPPIVTKGLRSLAALVEQDLREGRVVQTDAIKPPPETISQAIATSLAQ